MKPKPLTVKPPSTWMIWPLTYDAALEHRNATTPAPCHQHTCCKRLAQPVNKILASFDQRPRQDIWWQVVLGSLCKGSDLHYGCVPSLAADPCPQLWQLQQLAFADQEHTAGSTYPQSLPGRQCARRACAPAPAADNYHWTAPACGTDAMKPPPVPCPGFAIHQLRVFELGDFEGVQEESGCPAGQHLVCQVSGDVPGG